MDLRSDGVRIPTAIPEAPTGTIRVFVGADRSQLLAVRVLEHSIRRHTSSAVEVHPLVDVPQREPKDPLQRKRTGFSFARFLIPSLCAHRGRALYLDADMLVFSDLRQLWDTPFDGAKVVVQEELARREPAGDRRPRRRQCSVMLLDCERLDWDVDRIIDGLDAGRYTYEQLMFELCLLGDDEVASTIPTRWNSLEHWDESTCLLHYTDVERQPWTSSGNPLDGKWLDEVRRMLDDGSLSWSDVQQEIDLGHLRPSLVHDLRWGSKVPRHARSVWRRMNGELDRLRGYRPHRDVLERKRQREALLSAQGRGGSRKRKRQPSRWDRLLGHDRVDSLRDLSLEVSRARTVIDLVATRLRERPQPAFAAPPADGRVRLNLGCGDKLLPGYVNVDVAARKGVQPDLVSDLRALALPRDHAHEILAVHVIEHFHLWEATALLEEWLRVLAPGGRLVLECPNILHAAWELLADPARRSRPDKGGQLSMWSLYGDPRWRDPLMCHKWGYTPESLTALLESVGFVDVRQEPALFKRREPRDMRIVGRKR